MYFLTFSFLLVLSEIDQIRKLNKEKWDKINLAIELIDDLETYVQSHIKERSVILAEILKIRRILKSDEQQIFYKDS